ncbi:MAG: c-type cytochrome [Methylococcales bacterium]|nr:c-type cytochrome [Methylococcales bacterium]
MKIIVKILFGLSIVTLFSPSLYAADASAGEKKSVMCANCHGEKGISTSFVFPNLAGQKAGYIAAQLRAFKKGTRTNSMMQPFAKKLSTDDINNLAAFFASQKNETIHHPETNIIKKETASKAQMCKGCHGKNGEGRGTFPRLTSQHVHYLEQQLNNFKSGDRKGGPMSGIAKSLTEDDIKQLSHYFSNLNAGK